MSAVNIYIAPSKINLHLGVLWKRADEYHEIETIFYRVPQPHDTITVRSSDAFRFSCSDPSLETEDNLMLRAARAFADWTVRPLPNIHVHLEKEIPMGAGLGGGSSDAAAMLNILLHHSSAS